MSRNSNSLEQVNLYNAIKMRARQFVKNLIMVIFAMAGFQAKCQNTLFITESGAISYYSVYDSLLSKYQINYIEHWIDTHLGTCHLIEVGNKEAPAILLLPAAGCSAAGWYANLNELGKQHRVFALDIPGDAGKSVLGEEIAPLLIEDYNKMLLNILDNLELKNVILIGHSIGGFLATGFTISHAERVNKLILLSPVATHINIRWYFRLLLKMGGKPGKGPGAEKTLKMQAYRGFEPEPLFVDLMQNVRDYCQIKLVFPFVYSTHELSKIRVPVFMIIGSNEVLCSHKKSIKNAKQKFKNIDIYVIDKTGHTPNMEKPDTFNNLITDILGK
jgi:pimeloyl-ACP methyl ester carboxylesterase